MRYKLKCGGKPRKKAGLGVGDALVAGATLASAAMNVAATNSSAAKQAKAMTESAKIQAESIKQQTENNNQLQQESLDFTKSQNEENRMQQQDIQTTLQLLAGQQTLDERLDATKVAVKYGGKPKRKSLKSNPFYGGASNLPFVVTDGGGVIPIQTDNNGYGLYELYGNDHEHYHKTRGGKHKSGVGIKFSDGSVVEGEGNQNTNKGELLYVTPEEALFLSKHNIAGFNPREAVISGMHPEQAFNVQQSIKAIKGYKDDGSKTKKANYGTLNILDNINNITQFPSNNTGNVAAGATYLHTRPTLKCGGRKKADWGYGSPIRNVWGSKVSPLGYSYYNYNANTYNLPEFTITGNNPNLKLTLNTKADIPNISSISTNNINSRNNSPRNTGFWNNYGGAIISSGANLLGAGIGAIGNAIASKKMANAYANSAETIANAYRQMTTIDDDFIKEEDYAAPHSMAVIRGADTNINPQLERIRRDASYARNETNRRTLSDAARLQRNAATNDRMYQRMSEQYANKHNLDEQIKQANAAAITETAKANADRDVQARRDYTGARLALKQYNNNIKNQKLAGIAGAYADAATQTAAYQGSAMQNTMSLVGNAIQGSGSAFANTFDVNRQNRQNYLNLMATQDAQNKLESALERKDRIYAKRLFDSWAGSNDKILMEYASRLKTAFGF